MTVLIAAEWRKLFSQRATWITLVVGQLLILAGVSGLLSRDHPEIPDLAARAVGHLGLVSLLSMLIGILAVAGEYRHKTIVETFLTTPRRHQVITAKLVVAATTGLLFAAVGAVLAMAAAALWLSSRGGLPFDAALWKTIGGDIAWNALFAALGVGIGAAVRNLAAAVGAALAWIAVVEGIIAQLLGDTASRWLPFNAGMALGRVGSADTLSQPAAAAVLACYMVVCVAVGYLITQRADIGS
jgi:ABC-2 type transport system permease protein